jgi:high-affinity iron transporter
MLGQYLIAFREVLEAALITAIILAFLIKTKREHLAKYVWYGVYSAVLVSIILGVIIWIAYGNISKSSQVLFEGVAALIAVVVLTSMIYWMAAKGKRIREVIEEEVKKTVGKGTVIGLISLVFVFVFREGLETVLFLTPFLLTDATPTILGSVAGIIFGVLFAFAIFKVGMKIDLKKFFYFSSILLILLAGGLLGYSIHELIEYQELNGVDTGWVGEYAYNLNVPNDSIWHHKGIIGSVLAVMFGYAVKAEWLRVIFHITYLVVVLPPIVLIYKYPEKFERIAKLFNK